MTWRAVAEGTRPGRGRRPFRAVPAVSRSGPGHRRRGARDRVQAGRRRGLSRPRHGRGPRAPVPRRRPCWFRPRPAWRRSPTWRPAATGICSCRPAMAAPPCRAIEADRSARLHQPERGQFLSPAADRGHARHARARRAGHAVPQSPGLCAADPCAAPAATAWQCPNCTAWLVEHRARRELHLPPLRPRRADPAGLPGRARPKTRSRRSARAWSASPRKRRSCSPTRAGWSWPATPCPARTPRPKPPAPSRRAKWI